MKKLLLLLVIVSACLVWSQEGDEREDDSWRYDDAVTSPGVETIVTSDPITITALVQPEQEGQITIPDMNFVAGAESEFSRNQKAINIPLAYRWRNFGFSARVPYIIEKKVSVFDYDTFELKDVTTSGLGDIFASVSYGDLYEPYGLYYDINVGAKLPTGDDEADIPLGTGSTDINAALSVYKFDDAVTFKGRLIYIYNGEIETVSENDTGAYLNKTTWTSKRGGQIITGLGFDYRWKYNLTFSSDLTFGWAFDGETEIKSEDIYSDSDLNTTTKNKWDITGYSFSDMRQSVSYRMSLFDFTLGMRVPVYTYSNDDMVVGNIPRNFSVFFRTNYRIF